MQRGRTEHARRTNKSLPHRHRRCRGPPSGLRHTRLREGHSIVVRGVLLRAGGGGLRSVLRVVVAVVLRRCWVHLLASLLADSTLHDGEPHKRPTFSKTQAHHKRRCISQSKLLVRLMSLPFSQRCRSRPDRRGSVCTPCAVALSCRV
jgi:hypothetical protein